MAVPALLSDAWAGLGGAWVASPALPTTALLAALTLALAATQWQGVLSRLPALGAVLSTGVAAATAVGVAWLPFVPSTGVYAALAARLGSALAAALAGVAALAHVSGLALHARERKHLAVGSGWGRDALLVAGGAWLAWFVAAGQRSTLGLQLGLLALALGGLTSLHAAWRWRTGRHVYLVQVGVVGTYALVTNQLGHDLAPEVDSLFALVLGFALVGVTVLARRAGVPPVADATRRFAALLPLLVVLLMPGAATRQAALVTAGSSLLYATLAAAERSRLFGSLAALSANAALLVAALAEGLSGIEIFLGPLGLLLLMLGTLFRNSLPHPARNAVRILGGLLLYAPAAIKLSLQLGQAADARYAAAFGAICLLGVAAGMLGRIRAYLALGTLFLTLDVASNLVYAGLRNHRVGFVVLSLTGLTIIGGLVYTSLQREQVNRLLRSLRLQLAGWD